MYKITIGLTEEQKKKLDEQARAENKSKTSIVIEGLMLRYHIKRELGKSINRNLSITEKDKTIKDIFLP